MDRCGECSEENTCNSSENYSQIVCTNPDCNGPKSVICCPSEGTSEELSAAGVEFSIGNCSGTNTGSCASRVNTSECLLQRTDAVAGYKDFDKTIPRVSSGSGVEYSNVTVTMQVCGIDWGNYYKLTRKPMIFIKVDGKDVASQEAQNGLNTVVLENFEGGTVSLGMRAGNYCGENASDNWTCAWGGDRMPSRPGGPGGLGSCDNGQPAVCPDGYNLQNFINPYDGWTVWDVKLNYTKKSGYQSCTY